MPGCIMLSGIKTGQKVQGGNIFELQGQKEKVLYVSMWLEKLGLPIMGHS